MKPGRDHWWHEIVPQPAGFGADRADAVRTRRFCWYLPPARRAGPKGVVHGHAGFPRSSSLDLSLLMDFKRRRPDAVDVGHGLGRRPADRLYDAADRRDGGAGRRRAELRRIPTGCGGSSRSTASTYLGVAPTTIRTFMAQGSEPWKRFDLSRAARDGVEWRAVDTAGLAMAFRARGRQARAAAELSPAAPK